MHSNHSATSIMSVGVVFATLATTPLYALDVTTHLFSDQMATPDGLLGGLSLIVWSLLGVITLQYLWLALSANNRGEGGILSLMSLACRNTSPQLTSLLLMLGVTGAAFFAGEAVLTPPLALLATLEAGSILSPVLDPLVRPLALLLLPLPFLLLHRNHGRFRHVLGGLMVLWFLLLALGGGRAITQDPRVLAALDPIRALAFLFSHQGAGLVVLVAVAMVVGGSEALFIHMGSSQRGRLRLFWLGLGLPALVLNFLGQGSLLLQQPLTVAPFFLLLPSWGRVPMLLLAILVALISAYQMALALFSLTRQAIRLGYLPPIRLMVGSNGLYLPLVNSLLLLGMIGVVLGFSSSMALARAAALSSGATLLITAILLWPVMIGSWDWPPRLVRPLMLAWLLLAGLMVMVCGAGLMAGAWFPLMLALVLFAIMASWKWERFLLIRQLCRMSMPMELFLAQLEREPPARVPGTAVYLSRILQGVPQSLLHNLKHNKVLHERVVIMTFRTQDVPYVAADQHIEIEQISKALWRIAVTYGFHESPDVQDIIRGCAACGLHFKLDSTSFFLPRETLIPVRRGWLARWRAQLFILLSRNSLRANDFFRIPANRVVELGVQVEV